MLMVSAKMRKAQIVEAIVVSACLLTVIAYSVFHRSYAIPAHASIKALKLGIYFNEQLAQPVEELDWGILEPGENASKLLYIQNQANVKTTFFMSTDRWNPLNASDYISLAWNYTGEVCQVDEVKPVIFTLLVDENITGITTFSFELTVGVTG